MRILIAALYNENHPCHEFVYKCEKCKISLVGVSKEAEEEIQKGEYIVRCVICEGFNPFGKSVPVSDKIGKNNMEAWLNEYKKRTV